MGRKTESYVKVNGREVSGAGTGLRKSGTRFYCVDPETKKQVWFPSDLDRAVLAFAKWERDRTGAMVSIQNPDPSYVELPAVIPGGPPVRLLTAPERWHIPEDVFWAEARTRFRADPVEFAHHMNCPWMARPDLLKDAEPSMLLTEVWALYTSRKKEPTMQVRSDNKRYWETFVRISKAVKVEDITPDVVTQYSDTMYKEYGRKPTAIRHHFGLVRSVFTHAATKGKDVTRLQYVITLMGGLEFPEKSDVNPQPISRDHFIKWHDACDVKFRAIMLLMLNAAMRPEDVANLRWKNDDGSKVVDLDAGTLVSRRKKRGKVVRCCILWSRTIEAIRTYLKADPHNQPTVFVNAIGTPFASGRILGNNLRDVRKDKTNLPASVKIEHIRDGAYTAAVAAKVDLFQVKILCGHKVGIPDHYIQRGAYMVADACAAIERHYFPA